ncbi:uncharacterized protein LOC111086152 [Limulus polyphemus]|uniref:Uncharacterized protein LOC111086152 n=1 Tax=Limulus polyphemus TaxID=6850 RepID=A0ABM1SIU5_LIMPO|nr:uncharacterized protein LOC111086152 [Limulus polyphemus]
MSSSEEDEVFFGEISEKEKVKIRRYAHRKTEVFYSGFRLNRKSMLEGNSLNHTEEVLEKNTDIKSQCSREDEEVTIYSNSDIPSFYKVGDSLQASSSDEKNQELEVFNEKSTGVSSVLTSSSDTRKINTHENYIDWSLTNWTKSKTDDSGMCTDLLQSETSSQLVELSLDLTTSNISGVSELGSSESAVTMTSSTNEILDELQCVEDSQVCDKSVLSASENRSFEFHKSEPNCGSKDEKKNHYINASINNANVLHFPENEKLSPEIRECSMCVSEEHKLPFIIPQTLSNEVCIDSHAERISEQRKQVEVKLDFKDLCNASKEKVKIDDKRSIENLVNRKMLLSKETEIIIHSCNVDSKISAADNTSDIKERNCHFTLSTCQPEIGWKMQNKTSFENKIEENASESESNNLVTETKVESKKHRDEEQWIDFETNDEKQVEFQTNVRKEIDFQAHDDQHIYLQADNRETVEFPENNGKQAGFTTEKRKINDTATDINIQENEIPNKDENNINAKSDKNEIKITLSPEKETEVVDNEKDCQTSFLFFPLDKGPWAALRKSDLRPSLLQHIAATLHRKEQNKKSFLDSSDGKCLPSDSQFLENTVQSLKENIPNNQQYSPISKECTQRRGKDKISELIIQEQNKYHIDLASNNEIQNIKESHCSPSGTETVKRTLFIDISSKNYLAPSGSSREESNQQSKCSSYQQIKNKPNKSTQVKMNSPKLLDSPVQRIFPAPTKTLQVKSCAAFSSPTGKYIFRKPLTSACKKNLQTKKQPSKRTPKKHINVISPVAQYIQENPPPPLIRTFRPKAKGHLASVNKLASPELVKQKIVEDKKKDAEPCVSLESNDSTPVLPAAKYQAKTVPRLDEQQWDLITEVHTLQNSKKLTQYFPSPYRAAITKHKGTSKTIQWADHLASEDSLCASPSQAPSDAGKPILMNQHAGDQSSFLLDISSENCRLMEKSILELVSLERTNTLGKTRPA